MTHSTDEELENRNRKASAAMRGMHKTACYEQGDHPDECDSYFSLAADALDAIAALRAQLAEADAMIESQAKDHAENNIRLAEMSHRVSQLEGMVVSGQGEQIRLAADLLQAKIECNKANTRADRAEAALAAQIEYACAVIDAHAEYDQTFCCDGRECGCQGSSVHDVMKHFIRQPHDRTALDRLLADAEAKALRRAAQACDWGDIYGDNAVKCILSLIPEERA